MTQASYSYHWLRSSTQASIDEICTTIGGDFGRPVDRGNFNQPRHVQHESGLKVFYGSTQADQPNVIEVDGEACERFAPQAIKALSALGGRLTRFDVAADIEPADLARRRIREMEATHRRGQVQTNIKRKPVLTKNDNEGEGYTLYTGSRQSPLFFRAYDRRGPLRIEVEHKPHRSTAHAISQLVQTKTPQQIWQMSAKALIYPMAWYQELLRDDAEAMPVAERTPPEFAEILEHIVTQFGQTLYLFNEVGFTLENLVRRPDNPSGEFMKKARRFAEGATAAGYDGDKLANELKRITRKSHGPTGSKPKKSKAVDAPF